MAGRDLTAVTLVVSDPAAMARIRARHGLRLVVEEGEPCAFLRTNAMHGERFDLVYALGLPSAIDDQCLGALIAQMSACLAPNGTILLANLAPDPILDGWLDIVMNWRPNPRSKARLAGLAADAGMRSRTWIAPSGGMVFCEVM